VLKPKEPDPPELIDLFDELNREHFGGVLGRPSFTFTPTSAGMRAWYTHVPNSLSLIAITEETFKKGHAFALDSMLHEMVHHCLVTVDGGDDKKHGVRFVRLANQIGETLGLPPVAAGTEDARCWPQSVRPAEHYS
jgi:hypothetical protein